MPLSKRDKKVSLTQTKKKGSGNKKKLLEEVKSCVDKYSYLYVISVKNPRNELMGKVRQEWAHSRFFFGKNKVMCLALGKSKDDELKANLHEVSNKLRGQTGLLFTNDSPLDVIKWFEGHVVDEYARTGVVATHGVVLKAGSVPSFSHSIEPQLRKLGLHTSLERGVIAVLKDHPVCKRGEVLNSQQARILKLFKHKMAKFRVVVDGVWEKEKEVFKAFKEKKTKLEKNKTIQIIVENIEFDGNEIEEEEKPDDDVGGQNMEE